MERFFETIMSPASFQPLHSDTRALLHDEITCAPPLSEIVRQPLQPDTGATLFFSHLRGCDVFTHRATRVWSHHDCASLFFPPEFIGAILEPSSGHLSSAV